MAVDIGFVVAALLVLLWAFIWAARSLAVGRAGEMVDAGPEDPELIALLDEKSHLLADLRDLDLDFRIGKVDDADMRRQRTRLERRAVEVIKELERRGYGRRLDDAELDDADLEDEELDDDDLDAPGPEAPRGGARA